MQPKDKLLAKMRQEMSNPSYLSAYLNWMRGQDPKAADGLEADLIETFTSEHGLRVLILLQKSVVEMALPSGQPDSALRELNAVRNFVLEIRRYVAHG